MTNEELITTIRNKVERQFSVFLNFSNASQEYGYHKALEFVLSVLSDIEKSEKSTNQDELEKEINRYLEPIHAADIQFEPFTQMTRCARHFAKWGAKWQAEQLLKSSPLPEDTILFNKGVEEGKRLMMEEAVEGVVEDVSFNNGEKHNTIRFSFDEESLHSESRIWFPRCGKDGDKVRIIILKEEEEK